MDNVRHRLISKAFMVAVGIAALTLVALLSSGKLFAQSMMEYAAQQSATQAVQQQVAGPAQNTLAVDPLSPGIAEDQVAGKILHEHIPNFMARVKSSFIDSNGKIIWGSWVALLGLVFVLWYLWREKR